MHCTLLESSGSSSIVNFSTHTIYLLYTIHHVWRKKIYIFKSTFNEDIFCFNFFYSDTPERTKNKETQETTGKTTGTIETTETQQRKKCCGSGKFCPPGSRKKFGSLENRTSNKIIRKSYLREGLFWSVVLYANILFTKIRSLGKNLVSTLKHKIQEKEKSLICYSCNCYTNDLGSCLENMTVSPNFPLLLTNHFC